MLRWGLNTFNPTPIENHVLRGLDLTIPTGVRHRHRQQRRASRPLNAVSGDLMVDKGTIRIDGETSPD